MPHKDPVVRAAYLKAWRAANKEKTDGYQKAFIALGKNRTKQAILKTKYNSMKCRCSGKQQSALYYKGLPVLPKQDFYDWALNQPTFHALYEQWEKANYKQALAPSIDRIDSTKGYEISNMQWLTLAANVSKATSGPRAN